MTTTITVNQSILDGNLGDGWADQSEAATAYAEFLEERYSAALRAEFGDHVDLDIQIYVQRNTSGCARDAVVYADDPGTEIRAAEIVRFSEQGAWQAWCESDAAVEYFE